MSLRRLFHLGGICYVYFCYFSYMFLEDMAKMNSNIYYDLFITCRSFARKVGWVNSNCNITGNIAFIQFFFFFLIFSSRNRQICLMEVKKALCRRYINDFVVGRCLFFSNVFTRSRVSCFALSLKSKF